MGRGRECEGACSRLPCKRRPARTCGRRRSPARSHDLVSAELAHTPEGAGPGPIKRFSSPPGGCWTASTRFFQTRTAGFTAGHGREKPEQITELSPRISGWHRQNKKIKKNNLTYSSETCNLPATVTPTPRPPRPHNTHMEPSQMRAEAATIALAVAFACGCSGDAGTVRPHRWSSSETANTRSGGEIQTDNGQEH